MHLLFSALVQLRSSHEIAQRRLAAATRQKELVVARAMAKEEEEKHQYEGQPKVEESPPKHKSEWSFSDVFGPKPRKAEPHKYHNPSTYTSSGWSDIFSESPSPPPDEEARKEAPKEEARRVVPGENERSKEKTRQTNRSHGE